jgi:lipopolysaccharide export system ATP-binding protein
MSAVDTPPSPETTKPVPPAPAAAPRVIQLKELVKIYRGRKVVNNVSVDFHQGEIVGLLGPNGAGKTTTFYMTVGLVRPDHGQILLDGRDITREPMYRRARLGIGYLAQEASVFRKLTALENLLLVLELTGYPAAKRKDRAMALLEEMQIAKVANTRGYSLSGGERRRVEIARALAAEPSFVLLDEPFANIDPRVVEELQGIVRELKQRGIGVLITDHNAPATLQVIDRAYILADGQVITQGTPGDLASDPLARKLYFGENFSL